VFGVPDDRTGEAPIAAVHLDPSIALGVGELERLVADSLARYKHLRGLVEVDAIPRLPSGKALRRALRDEWTALPQPPRPSSSGPTAAVP
jgi:acyl-CoA synthetase (AMP-forming)/AMP-acid ligase II